MCVQGWCLQTCCSRVRPQQPAASSMHWQRSQTPSLLCWCHRYGAYRWARMHRMCGNAGNMDTCVLKDVVWVVWVDAKDMVWLWVCANNTGGTGGRSCAECVLQIVVQGSCYARARDTGHTGGRSCVKCVNESGSMPSCVLRVDVQGSCYARARDTGHTGGRSCAECALEAVVLCSCCENKGGTLRKYRMIVDALCCVVAAVTGTRVCSQPLCRCGANC